MRSCGYLLIEGVKNLWKNRTMTSASVVVLVASLLITAVAVILSINLDSIMEDLQGGNSITIYLEDSTPKLVAVQIGEEIRSMDNVATCEYIQGEDALEDLMESMGSSASVFEGLDNFLPDALQISLTDLSLYEETISTISNMEYIDTYTDYSEVAETLNEIRDLVDIAGIVLIVILGTVSLFIISNTIKVTMFSRRIEISIMKSVGATNLFIRIPFIVEGLLIGIISGSFAFLAIDLAYDAVTMQIYKLLPIITIVNLDMYELEILLAFIIVGSVFGVFGGLISINRFLKNEGEKITQ